MAHTLRWAHFTDKNEKTVKKPGILKKMRPRRNHFAISAKNGAAQPMTKD